MALKNKAIIILGHAKFDSTVESTAFTVAKYLAKENQVFYVEHPFTCKDYFKFREQDYIKKRISYFSLTSDGIISTQLPNLKVVITPPVLPINFIPEGRLYRLILKINDQIVARRIKKVIRKYKLQDVVYINIFDFHFPNIAKTIRPALNVYYCVDPMIVPYDMKHGIVSEHQLVENSDLVICTSRQLYEEKKQQNSNTFFIPNAADTTHSSKARDEALPVHPLIADLKKPVIGYFGTVERRIDFDVLHEVIKSHPDKSFVLAGPISEGFVPTWAKKSIRFTGPVPYSEMPAMVKGFDIAIIPFKKDNVSRTIFPLKLFEYLGAGKPVICTDFNLDLAEFTEDTVIYCPDAISFSHAIQDICDHGIDDRKNVQKRLEVAAKNTWEKRGMALATLLEEFMQRKQKI